MKVFKRGGFIILDDAGVEAPIPITNFDYQIISDIVKMRDVAEQIGYSSLIVDLQDEFGVPVGNAAAIATYFATLTATTGGGGDASAANQLLEIAELQAINAKQDAEVTAFVTTSLLASGATFDSGVLDAATYTQVQTEIKASHDGTIDISFCSDAAGLDVVRSLSIPYVAADGYQFFSAPAFVNFIKYEFTNAVCFAQTDFYYTTKFLSTGLSPQLLTTGAFIAPAMVAHLGRNIIVGQNDAGQFKNVNVDNQNHLEVNASNPKTSYDELPVANYSPVDQITFPYNINTDIVDITEIAGGTVAQANNMALLNTSATTASSAVVTSISQIPYRAGQGHIARFSCIFVGVPSVATAYMGIGVGDVNDGYGFKRDNLGFNISYRTNGVETNVIQTAWNIDKLDGTGPSGMTIDITKGNAYQVAYGSGFGTVNFSVESDVSGDYVLVHTLALANMLTEPSAFNPTFPIRAEATNGAGTDNLTLSVDAMSSFIEGENAIKYARGVLNSQSGVENGTFVTEVEIITFFHKSDVFGGTGNNKVYCKILGISWLNECNKTSIVKLREEATGMAAGTFTDIGANTSVVSYRTDGTGTPAGGKVLFEAFAEKDGKGGIFVNLSDLNLVMTPGKKYTITAMCTVAATVKDQLATLLWTEDY